MPGNETILNCTLHYRAANSRTFGAGLLWGCFPYTLRRNELQLITPPFVNSSICHCFTLVYAVYRWTPFHPTFSVMHVQGDFCVHAYVFRDVARLLVVSNCNLCSVQDYVIMAEERAASACICAKKIRLLTKPSNALHMCKEDKIKYQTKQLHTI